MTKAKQRHYQAQCYYEAAIRHLKNYKFKNKRQQKIWNLHTSGYSIKFISFILKLKCVTVYNEINKLRIKMKLIAK